MTKKNPTMEKKCTSCNKTKPLSDFYKNRTRKDGHDNICRECRRALYWTRAERTPRTSIETNQHKNY